MSRSPFRPRLEALDERALLSGTLSISQPSNQPVSVNYATADGTATAAGGDYIPIAGTLTFAKGQTAQTITVMVNGTSVAEPDETFLVKLSKPSHATVADGTGVGTILEPVPAAINDSTGTYQARVATGNVLANDADPAGGGLTVGTVNGSAVNVGATIRLASGALLTVSADGSYTYDPNGAFWYLDGTGGMASDSFTYTATDSLGEVSNTATVAVYISDYYGYGSYGGTYDYSGYSEFP